MTSILVKSEEVKALERVGKESFSLPSWLGIFKKHIAGRIVTEFEVNLFLTCVCAEIQIGIQNTIAITIGSLNNSPLSGLSRTELIDVNEPSYQDFSCVYFKHTIGTRPILNGSAPLILSFLRATSTPQATDGYHHNPLPTSNPDPLIVHANRLVELGSRVKRQILNHGWNSGDSRLRSSSAGQKERSAGKERSKMEGVDRPMPRRSETNGAFTTAKSVSIPGKESCALRWMIGCVSWMGWIDAFIADSFNPRMLSGSGKPLRSASQKSTFQNSNDAPL